MTHQNAAIESTVHLGFASNNTSGSGDDGATPTFDVHLAGAAANAAPVLSGIADRLTHVNFPPGCHSVAVAATVANGFVANATYLVYVTIDVDSQDPTGFIGSFTLTPLATSAQADRNADLIESQRGFHTWQGGFFYVDPVNGDTHANGNRGGRLDPYLTIQDCHDNAVTANNHDVIFLVAGAAGGVTTHTVAATTTISKRYTFIRGPGRDFIVTRTGSGNTFLVTADGIEISGIQIGTGTTGSGDGINVTDADFHRIHNCWFLDTRGDGIHSNRGGNMRIHDNHFFGTGVSGSGQGVHISGTGGAASNNAIFDNEFADTAGDAILVENGTIVNTQIYNNTIHGATGWGINIGGASTDAMVYGNTLGGNSSGNIQDNGTTSVVKNNTDWLSSTVEGRSLDVSAGGEAGIDWANVGSPTTVVGLTNTTVGTTTVVTTKTGYSLAAAGLDSVVVEVGLNARQALSINAAANGGKISGAATTEVVILGAGVATTRITATVDSSGNRSAVTLAPPA